MGAGSLRASAGWGLPSTVLIPQHIVQHWVHMGLRGHTDNEYQYRLQLQQDNRARQLSSEVTRAQVAAQAFQIAMDPTAA